MVKKRILRIYLLIFSSIFLLFFSRADALVINNYDHLLYDRFVSGTYGTSNPVSNPNFFASSYDWSGVGWDSINPMRSVAMISPEHFVGANHWQIPAGDSVTFFNKDGQLKSYTVAKYSTFSFTDADGTHTSDLVLGWLTQPIAASDKIAHYPVLSADEDWYIGKEIYAYGWNAKAGMNTLDSLVWAGAHKDLSDMTATGSFFYDNTGFFPGLAGVEPGDSGSPSFIPWAGQLTLMGTHFGVDGVLPDQTSWNSYDSFIPYYMDDINAAMAPSGYSVDNVVVPEPSTCLLVLSGLMITCLFSTAGRVLQIRIR